MGKRNIKGKKEHLLYKNRKEGTFQMVCHVKDMNSLSNFLVCVSATISARRSLCG